MMNVKQANVVGEMRKFARGFTAVIAVAIAGWLIPATATMEELRLQGAGTLRWLGLKIYEAKLFAPSRFHPTQFSQQPFALELTYARNFGAGSIVEKSMDEIQRLGLGNPGQHLAWRTQMLAIFPNVKAGDRIRGIHQPGSGAQFFHNGRPIGRIDDTEFAQAFFAIWLDPRTAKPTLRQELLGLTASARS